MPQLLFEIVADDRRFVAALNRGEISAGRLDEALERMTGGAVTFNQSLQTVDATTRRFVSGQEVMNRMGIMTTRQFNAQIAVYNELIARHQQDALVTAQLVAQKRQLIGSMQGVTTNSGRMSQGVHGLSFLINDLQQATYGWSAAIRATSNNMPILLSMLGSGTGLAKWVPWLSVALSAATTAFVLFDSRAKDVADTSEDLNSKLDGVASQMIRIKQAQPIFEAQNVEAARAMAEHLKSQADELDRQLKARQILSPIIFPGQRPVFAPVVGGETREAMERRLAILQELSTEYADQADKAEALAAAAEEIRKSMEATGAPVKETTKEQEKYVSLIQREIEQRTELQKQVAELANGGAVRLLQIQRQNEALQEQIRVTMSLAQLRADGLIGQQLQGMQGLGVRDPLEGTVLGMVGGGLADPRSILGVQQAIATQRQALEQATTQVVRDAALQRIEALEAERAAMLGLAVTSEEVAQRQIVAMAASAAAQARSVSDIVNAVRQVIKAKLAEAIAGMISKAILTSGGNPVVALVAATAGAGAVSMLFDKLVPEFGGGGASGMGGRSQTFYGSNARRFEQPRIYGGGWQGQPSYAPGYSSDRSVMHEMAAALNQTAKVMARIDQQGVQASFNRTNFSKAGEAAAYHQELTGTKY